MEVLVRLFFIVCWFLLFSICMLETPSIHTILLSSGYPNEPAADVALNTVKKWIEENPDKVRCTDAKQV